MCDCHPMTADEQKTWARVKQERRTREDWEDLHGTIEQYKRRLIRRHDDEAITTLPNRECVTGGDK